MIKEARNDLFLRPMDHGPRPDANVASEPKQDRVFEKVLSQAQPKKRSSSKSEPKKKDEPSARNEKSENLWSQTGAGKESRKPEERKPDDRKPDAGTARVAPHEARASARTDSRSSDSGVAAKPGSKEDVSAKSAAVPSAVADAQVAGQVAGQATGPLGRLRAGSAETPVSGQLSGDKGVSLMADPEMDDGVEGANAALFGLPLVAVPMEKQKSMTDFMEHMQSEFGVPPAKILAAFDKMDLKTLQAPPEETAEVFVANLTAAMGLKAEQTARAKELYASMLKTTGVVDLDSKLEQLSGESPAMSPEDEHIFNVMSSLGKNLNESIDALNRSFGVKPQMGPNKAMTPEQLEAEIAKLAQLNMGRKKMAGEKGAEQAIGLQASALSPAVLSSQKQQQDGAGAFVNSAGDDENSIGPAGNISALAVGSQSAAQESALSGGQGFGSSAFSGQSGSQAGLSSSAHTSTSLHAEMSKAMKDADAGPAKVSAKSAPASLGPEIVGADASPTAALNVAGPKTAALATGAVVPGALPGVKITSEEQEANLKELVKQAQLIVKKGGGEMNLELRPEGAGQIHLKINVDNGQVSVQMLAENESAKKMLQDSLHELKASMAAHKLNVESMRVDSMKVDVGSEIRKHMDQQGSQDASREQSKQMAQDFMQQFRDDREGFRDGLFDSSNVRSYGRATKRAEVGPDQVSAASVRRADSSRRLNLMA